MSVCEEGGKASCLITPMAPLYFPASPGDRGGHRPLGRPVTLTVTTLRVGHGEQMRCTGEGAWLQLEALTPEVVLLCAEEAAQCQAAEEHHRLSLLVRAPCPSSAPLGDPDLYHLGF
jgi:hypothetical protein